MSTRKKLLVLLFAVAVFTVQPVSAVSDCLTSYKVGQAGWEPITRATSSDSAVMIERFGEQYLTVYNDSTKTKELTITFKEPVPTSVTELVTGTNLQLNSNRVTLTVEGERTAILYLNDGDS